MMTDATLPPAELARTVFGEPELRSLWTALRHRYERETRQVRSVRVSLGSAAEREALADLLGLDRLPGSPHVVRLDRLDARVGEVMPGLTARDVVELLSGPLADVPGERARHSEARRRLWTWLETHPTVVAEPGLAEWVATVRRAGMLDGSPERTRGLLERCLTVLSALPADGRPLPSFADAVLDDPHALDEGRLPKLVLRALAVLRGQDPPRTAEERRKLWEEVGIACDALSTTVLIAGLRPAGPSPLAAVLRTWADAGHATSLTLAQMQAESVGTVKASVCWVVENPSVVAEALDLFGPATPPLVCTAGWPNSAAMALLRELRDQDVELRYHGDLDGDGVRIAAHLRNRSGATIWGMTAEDYRQAVRADGRTVGRVSDAPWDPHLATVMRQHGIAVSQEQVAWRLLEAMQPTTGDGGNG